MSGGGEGESLASWKPSGFLSAVRHDNVFAIDAPTLALPSPSILAGVDTLCHALDEARTRSVR